MERDTTKASAPVLPFFTVQFRINILYVPIRLKSHPGFYVVPQKSARSTTELLRLVIRVAGSGLQTKVVEGLPSFQDNPRSAGIDMVAEELLFI